MRDKTDSPKPDADVQNTQSTITGGAPPEKKSMYITGITADDRPYNRSSIATIDTSGAKLEGPDADCFTLDFSNVSATFADPRAGNHKLVTISGVKLCPHPDKKDWFADLFSRIKVLWSEHYPLTQPTAMASILPAALTVTGLIANKTYDGTTSATFNSGAQLTGVIAPDDVALDTSGATASFASARAGNQSAVVNGLALSGADKGNYSLQNSPSTATILPAALTVTDLIANKTYDGTTAATFNSGAQLAGVIAPDDVALDTNGATANFASARAGNQSAVVNGLALSGADKGNYSLQNSPSTATILPAELTVTGITVEDKAYDGSTAAKLNFTCTAPTLVGVLPIDKDNVALDTKDAKAQFNDPNAGNGKTVVVYRLALKGEAALNYTVQDPTLTANITPAPPGNNLRAAVGRVLGDPTASAGVTELVRNATTLFGGKTSGENTATVQCALDSIASALAGTDAVQAIGEPYGGQLRLEIYLRDAISGKEELLGPEFVQKIDIQVIDSSWNLASSSRTIDKDGVLFSQVEPGDVFVALPQEIAEAVLSDQYDVMDAGSCEFTRKTRATNDSTPATSLKAAAVTKDNATASGAAQTRGFRAKITAGQQSKMKCYVQPETAQVRCFSCLDGDSSCCDQGKQYISNVSVEAMQGDNVRQSGQTGNSGCVTFTLRPGWYTFSAWRDVTIGGCNYELATSSPISAFLGAGQTCSDIYFRYKKKGSEIEVISEILYPDPGNPYVTAKNVFAGMEYLLLNESDSSFVQQQTTPDGSPLSFRNLAAGPYLLFCQAPAAYNSQPVQPVQPPGGRLALTVFGGQVSPVPVKVKFKTGITAPAVLDGYVRDDTGMPIVGQVVLIVNDAGCIVAAGTTDTTGYYSIQIYSAENLTIVVGAQQVTVSKAQIQQAMKKVGTPALPSPGSSMDQALQTADLVGFNN